MRYRPTHAELEQLDSQIIAVLNEDHPQSVRHVFYRMTDPRLPVSVPKTENGYKRIVARCIKLRRTGVVPYSWIADASRSGLHVATWADAGQIMRSAAESFRTDPWLRLNDYVEVWCESRSIAGILRGECAKRIVSLYPSSGFTSLTLAYEASRRIKSYVDPDKTIHVIYVGDYDPAGLLIPESVENELATHLEDYVLDFQRIAITEEQIRDMNLPTKPRKESDRRRPDVQETVEAEAMPAGVMRNLVGSEIDKYLPKKVLERAERADMRERRSLRVVAKDVSRLSAKGVAGILAEHDCHDFNFDLEKMESAVADFKGMF